MMLAGLLVLVAATALMVRGFAVVGALCGVLALVLLILGRPLPSVDAVSRKGRKS